MKLKKLTDTDITLIIGSLELTINAWQNWINTGAYPEGWNKKTCKHMVKQLEELLARTNEQTSK